MSDLSTCPISVAAGIAPFIDNQWNHVLIFYNKNTNAARLYLNGKMVGSNNCTGNKSLASISSEELTIGGYSYFGSTRLYKKAKIDGIRIYDAAPDLP
ncbi:MAG: hypothetical protein NTW46_00640 [Candidatus Nealsonbacteria bacterium]|nr:hypothetical protein [Candidatus Nealsonbacteria bacterium]